METEAPSTSKSSRRNVPETKSKAFCDHDDSVALEGGWGWVVVAASFFVYVMVFGSLRCQSVLFVPIMQEFGALYSTVGWVAALATLGLAFAGILSAPLMSKFGHRTTIMIGGIIACASSVIAHFLPSLELFDIFAGLLTGVGLGVSFVSAPVLIGFYFKRRRSLATNIASIGASIGTFIVCPLNGWLIDSFGLRGYFLILAGLFLNLSVAGALMRPVALSNRLAKGRRDKTQTLKVLEVSAQGEQEKEDELASAVKSPEPKPWHSLFKSPAFVVYCLSQVVFLGGFLVYQLYIVPFAELELGISNLKAPLIMSITAATEVISRIVFGILGDIKRINRVLMFAAVQLILAVCAFILPFTNSFETLAVIAAVTGLFQGGFSGISVVILADIVGLELYGTALGISTFLNGFATLASPPLVGIAVDITKKPSTALFISAGILLLGAILSFLIQVAINFERRERRRRRDT